MENNKIYVDANEFARLCRLDGKVGSVLDYVEKKCGQGGYVDSDVILAILNVKKEG